MTPNIIVTVNNLCDRILTSTQSICLFEEKTKAKTSPTNTNLLYLDDLLYGKCLKISCITVADKMAYANSANPDQTAHEGVVWSGFTLFAILLNILRDNCAKSKI